MAVLVIQRRARVPSPSGGLGLAAPPDYYVRTMCLPMGAPAPSMTGGREQG